MQNDAAVLVSELHKSYSDGFKALDDVSLQIARGEVFALLGPNGAGKSTLINTICGLVTPTSGSISVLGSDNIRDYKIARSHIGLVPQELSIGIFETVLNTVTFSRMLFGKPQDSLYIEDLLKRLSLWDKKDAQIRSLSGGMKRRVMIAKALSHEPDILFLDEPSSGVDVELRHSMWKQVRELQQTGVTIILTTHYIEEAEEMADRIAIINKGKVVLVEQKKDLMEKLGSKKIVISLCEKLAEVPAELSKFDLSIDQDGRRLTFIYDTKKEGNEIYGLLNQLKESNIRYKDIDVHQSSLEEIFIKLVNV